jgi:hypothetical protein
MALRATEPQRGEMSKHGDYSAPQFANPIRHNSDHWVALDQGNTDWGAASQAGAAAPHRALAPSEAGEVGVHHTSPVMHLT